MGDYKRLHFGVLFSNLDDTCQYDIWTGIADAADKRDIHLTAYVGMYQTTKYDLASHYETCFELIKQSSSLDGVIIFSGFIASTIGDAEFNEFIARISEILPLVSVSYVIPGIPSVLVDNTSGIYDAVKHMIQVHGKKRIAFVKGPDGHLEAEDRFKGYKKALAANGLVYDERYVFPGSFSQLSGQLAVKQMLKTPDISVDAIVACDDTTAMGVLHELIDQNVLVPTDIAVAGFDDDRDSATFIPSISTVRQDFSRIGRLSADVLYNKVIGIPVKDITYMSPVFVARQSCGCLEVELSDTDITRVSDRTEINSLGSFVISRFALLFGHNTPEQQIKEWASAFACIIKNEPFSKDDFLHLLNDALIRYSHLSKNLLIWNEALGILTKSVELYSSEVRCPLTVMSVFAPAAALVQGVRFKEEKVKELTESDNRVMLRRIASNIVSIFDNDSLVDELRKSLPELSINTVIIGLYDTPVYSNDSVTSRTITMLLGFDGDTDINTRINEPDQNRPAGYSAFDKFVFENRRSMFLFPLFFKDEEYGVMLMPFDPTISVETYETLRVNISTAIKGAGLIKEVGHQNTLLNAALERATEASKAKSAFLSAMSHEMRTPMNAIIGMTAIGKKASEIEDKNYTLSKIEDASSHLLGVINDVLDMAKIEANKLMLAPVGFDFNQMLQKVISIINYRADEKKQTLSVSVDNRVPRFIFADDQRLSQVITNLLSNAVKFTPDGGRIHLEVSLIKESSRNCELRISITDSGIGISPEQQTKIFNAFEQAESGTNRNYGGTGLGLVISKSIIELMDGRIWVESELGKGAKFIFEINALCGEETIDLPDGYDASSAQYEKGVVKGAFAGKMALLAEDIEVNREIFLSLLDDTGLVIECAENGKKAYEIVERDPEKFDIIFMDVQMPVMSGHEATRLIRKIPALQGVTLPIIAMTANVFKSDIEDCLAVGMDDHLGKPFDLEKLLLMLQKYLFIDRNHNDTQEDQYND